MMVTNNTSLDDVKIYGVINLTIDRINKKYADADNNELLNKLKDWFIYNIYTTENGGLFSYTEAMELYNKCGYINK